MWRILKLASLFLAMNMVSTSYAAEGKLADWGPLKFGMSFDQIKAVAPKLKPLAQDEHDSDISFSELSSANLASVPGVITARFYKDRAFEFTFFAVNGLGSVVPRTSAGMSPDDKMAQYCPNVFEVVLDLLSASYGRADEISRPSDPLRLDRTQGKASKASWWFSDGSRTRLISTQPPGNLGICTEFISIRSARYAKSYVPELVDGGSK